MKRLPIIAAIIVLAAGSGCKKEPVPELPSPPGTEEQTTPQDPQVPDPGESVYPVDVRTAIEGTGLVNYVISYTSYSPHSGISVSELRYKDYAGSPQAVFVMQVDLSDPTVTMTNTVPGGATTGFTGGRERLSAQFKRIDTPRFRVEGGVNTDFFVTTGDNAGTAQGIFWHNGICLRDVFASQATRPRCFVYWGSDDKVRMAPSSDYSSVKSSVTLIEAFSGGQFLTRNGAFSTITEDSVYGVHPRTMIGVLEDNTKIVLVVLDGRDNSLAVGMNYPDMQKIMKALGSYDSINIDGGGSSTFIVRKENDSGYGQNAVFQIKNNPSDGSERAIGPGLAIISTD